MGGGDDLGPMHFAIFFLNLKSYVGTSLSLVLYDFFLKKNVCCCISLFVYGLCMCLCTHAWLNACVSLVKPVWRSEDNLMGYVLSFDHGGLEDQTLVVRLVSKHLYVLNWPSDCILWKRVTVYFLSHVRIWSNSNISRNIIGSHHIQPSLFGKTSR